jgi:catechol 2,3-dioxygenase-like lactoylglutathione lyase family enzyme
MSAYSDEDVGNIVSLEHINVQVPDQSLAILFYVVGMGFTRDPYLTVGLSNMWINVGEQQFHLPTRKAQVIDGHIGIVVPDLDALEDRLKSVTESLKETNFEFTRKGDHIAVICPWGNRYRCYSSQAIFGDMVLGIPYVEFSVRPGAMAAILNFYESVFHVPVMVERDDTGDFGRVKIGRAQSLFFRESDKPLVPYDGHHIAIYVANFSGPYGYLKDHGLISEDVRNHQFRFKDIVDPKNGAPQFALEHEVRSLRHPMYHRPFVNRDPMQSQRSYRRGWDAFVPFQH